MKVEHPLITGIVVVGEIELGDRHHSALQSYLSRSFDLFGKDEYLVLYPFHIPNKMLYVYNAEKPNGGL